MVTDSNKNALDSYWNAIYMTGITLSTVGYGDLPPCTNMGRFLLMVLGCVGAFYIGLLVVVLEKIFDLSNEQQMAFSHIKLTKRAAQTIQKGFKYFLAKKKLYLLRK